MNIGVRKFTGAKSGTKEELFPWYRDEDNKILSWGNTTSAQLFCVSKKWTDYIIEPIPSELNDQIKQD